MSDTKSIDALGFELAHIGVNCENETDAMAVAELFALAFGFSVKAGSSSIFAGSAVECMKTPFLGKNGHIAIRTNSIDDARKYLTSKGFGFDETTAKTDAEGKPLAVYLDREFGGFAVHLLQKK